MDETRGSFCPPGVDTVSPRGTFIRPKDSCWPEVALARARSVLEFIRPMCSCWPEVEVARSGQKAAYRLWPMRPLANMNL